MKPILVLTCIAALFFASCNQQPESTKNQTINPIIGDISYIEKFGVKPDASTDENLRIKTHLEYVEHLLRQKDAGGLSKELAAQRTKTLDLLHAYWTAGAFPKNYDYKEERKPCFIDRNGTI